MTPKNKTQKEEGNIRSSPTLELARPLNCLLTGVAVIIGAAVTVVRIDIQWVALALAFAAAALVAAGGNAVNDYFDREIDSVNRPERPIPSGRITAKKALTVALALFIVGVLLTVPLNIYCVLLAALNSVMLAMYAWKLKRSGLAGNLAIGYLVGSTFLFGGLAMGSSWSGPVIPSELLVLVSMAALSTVGRELIKAIQDMRGDQKLGFRTFPLMHGANKAAALAIVFILLAIILSPMPYILEIFGWHYLVPLVFSIAAFVAAVVVIASNQEPAAAGRASLACKIGMGLGLLAFLVGVLTRLL